MLPDIGALGAGRGSKMTVSLKCLIPVATCGVAMPIIR